MSSSTNKYSGTCTRCGAHVPASSGYIIRSELRCKRTECISPQPAVQTKRRIAAYDPQSSVAAQRKRLQDGT